MQVKKALHRGDRLWTALDALADGIHDSEIAYGALIVDSDASATIRSELSRGIERIGDGRADNLDEIAVEFNARLRDKGLSAQFICSRLRILVMHCADNDAATEQAAKTGLRKLRASEQEAH